MGVSKKKKEHFEDHATNKYVCSLFTGLKLKWKFKPLREHRHVTEHVCKLKLQKSDEADVK